MWSMSRLEPASSSGAVGRKDTKPDNNMLRFLLNARLPQRYGAQRPEALVPGHPTYERIAAEAVEAFKKYRQTAEYEDEILNSINAKLEKMRQRRIAMREAAAAKAAEDERGEPGEAAALPAPEGPTVEDRPRGPRVVQM